MGLAFFRLPDEKRTLATLVTMSQLWGGTCLGTGEQGLYYQAGSGTAAEVLGADVLPVAVPYLSGNLE